MNSERQTIQEQAEPEPQWMWIKLLAFRFAVIFFALFDFGDILDWLVENWGQSLPVCQSILDAYRTPWHQLVQFVGSTFMNIHENILDSPWAPGDNTHGWLRLLCILAMSFLGTMLWTVLDRKRKNYAVLQQWFRLALRMNLSYWLIIYGLGKLAQFPGIPINVLIEPIGNLSPSSLLWLFMGFSKPYTYFSGVMEVSAALFLLCRRTTLMGALLAAAIMTNVFMMNLCYNVTVKQFSCFLLVTSIVLILPDLARLWKFFARGASVEKSQPVAFSSKKWLNQLAIFLPAVLAIHTGFAELSREQGYMVQQAKVNPLKGIWNTNTFKFDGKELPPLETDDNRWSRVVFSHPGLMQVYVNDNQKILSCLFNEAEKRITVGIAKNPYNPHASEWKPEWEEENSFFFQQSSSDTLSLNGTYQGHRLEAKFSRVDENQFPLQKYKFSWVLDQKNWAPNLLRQPRQSNPNQFK